MIFRGLWRSLARAIRTVCQAESSSRLIDSVSSNQLSALLLSHEFLSSSAISTMTVPIRRLMLSTYRAACRSFSGGSTSRFTTIPTPTPRSNSMKRSLNMGSSAVKINNAVVAMATPSSRIHDSLHLHKPNQQSHLKEQDLITKNLLVDKGQAHPHSL